MPADPEDFSRSLKAIGECDAVAPLREASMRTLGVLGMDSAYFIAPLTRDSRVGRMLTAMNLSWVWERHYRARLQPLDPLPQIAMEKLTAFVWPDDVEMKKLSRSQRRYLDIAARHGLGRGIGVACFGPNARSGFLGAVLPPDGPPPASITIQRVHTVGQVSFQTYCRLIHDVNAIPPLSNRELEVLHWIGRGKSNSVIAEILGISASSVDVYVRRIFAKLEVSDRTTASVKAYSLGLLISGDYERFVQDTASREEAERKSDS